MILLIALLGACAPLDDWHGDWEGQLDGSADGVGLLRLIDVTDQGDLAVENSTGFRYWSGTLEHQAGDSHLVAPVVVYSCEDDTCTIGDESYVTHGYFLFAWNSAGQVNVRGSIDGDTAEGEGSYLRPGNPSVVLLTLARADSDLQVGDP